MYPLLLLSSLLHVTTCTVYTVTPDDHYYPNTTCHHCHNLQHYLLNITKYFTSNTQLLFLPGLHHLHSDLIIQNVHNISLIGSTPNDITPDTVIQVNISYILMVNISKLTIRSISININHSHRYIFTYILLDQVPLTIKDCSFISLHQIRIYQQGDYYDSQAELPLVAINIMGESYFNNVHYYHGEMQLFYNETHTDREHHSLSMDNCTIKSIKIHMVQNMYTVTLRIVNMQVKNNKYAHDNDYDEGFIYARGLGTSKVMIINCQFISNIYRGQLFYLASSSNASVDFINCHFINNKPIALSDSDKQHTNIQGNHDNKTLIVDDELIKLSEKINVEFNNCDFHGKSDDRILGTHGKLAHPRNIVIRNTSYTTTMSDTHHSQVVLSLASYISLSHTTLKLMGSVNFYNIIIPRSIIALTDNSTVIISGTVNFSYNLVRQLINFDFFNNIQYIIIKENSILNINHNEVSSLFITNLPTTKYPYPFCFFQYFTSSTSKAIIEMKNISIKFYNNQCNHTSCYVNIPLTNCHWLEKLSLSNNTVIPIPLEINNYYIQIIDNSVTYMLSQLIEQSSLCVCTNELHYDCHISNLGYLYPGKTLTISLYYHKVDTANAVVVKTDIDQRYVTSCTVLGSSENIQFINKNCTTLHYTIGFPTANWCELFLKIASDSDEYLNIFYIRQITCPTGFVKIDKRCQCDPVLVQYGITNCNINDQAILRPANSWISATDVTDHNNSYTYHISLHCPFHYCLPHSSHLNFSTPNSQCQFDRSGLLCGHCQQGLSTVFSSFHCQHCSNIYLLLIIPIAIAGLVLVLLLFILNLTVTDGTINGFVLYVNIISINAPVIFTELNQFKPTYTFISIANLDLGIQTCFYNGMDDYAKMWLQLAFPFYLIFIAILIIITSRYSTTVQRITARRALPVLATLFLLSYTKILRIVCSVLFFYSTITHLPSKHTTLVWSVDANVSLFGVRFTILFIVCLILFLILVPFNVILLFPRTLSRFRFINKFKPLLDAYQGPYKIKFHYWTGLQLVIRAVLFGISSLDRKINVAISIVIFGMIIGMHGMVQPFKTKCKNYQEAVLFLNLQGLYVVSLYGQGSTSTTAVQAIITMAAIHFIFIITYHMITYVYDGVIRSKIQLGVNTFTGRVTRLHKKLQPQRFLLQDNIRDNMYVYIPEVSFEFREPLLGQDY